MTSDELLALFRRGLIPGPSESEEEFFRRAQERIPRPEWTDVTPLSFEWGFKVDWVPLLYSKKKLLPWEGAIFWATHIQLHPTLQTKKLFGNSLTDILHHESIHAAREAFNEPQFEELLAYTTAPSLWKRWIGPLFSRIWEFPLFAISLFFLPFTLPIPAFFLLRLLYLQLTFHRLKKRFPFPVLFCLTDQEIRTLGRTSQPFVPDGSPRGRLIAALLNVG